MKKDSTITKKTQKTKKNSSIIERECQAAKSAKKKDLSKKETDLACNGSWVKRKPLTKEEVEANRSNAYDYVF